VVSVVFLCWRWRKRTGRKRQSKTENIYDNYTAGPKPGSQARAIGDLTTSPYSKEHDGGYFMPNDPVHENGYTGEKGELPAFAGPAVPATAQLHINDSVSSWLYSQGPQTADPMAPRTSKISTATGLTAWSPVAPGSSALDPSDFPAVPPFPMDIAGTGNLNPQAGSRMPQPPAPSVAPTEVTNRTSGTWNTWGVEQHREKREEGWKKVWSR
jgi:hypothetical protein